MLKMLMLNGSEEIKRRTENRHSWDSPRANTGNESPNGLHVLRQLIGITVYRALSCSALHALEEPRQKSTAIKKGAMTIRVDLAAQLMFRSAAG